MVPHKTPKGKEKNESEGVGDRITDLLLPAGWEAEKRCSTDHLFA